MNEGLEAVDKDVSAFFTWMERNQDLLLQTCMNLASAILILVVGIMIGRVAAGAVGRLLALRGIDKTIADFLTTLVRYSILAFTLIAVLSRLGVQTASVIAVMGAAGLAVGLSLQGSLSNFAAGVLLVMFRPLRAGEYVDLGDVEGTVDSVHIFSTTLRTVDNRIVVVPNSKIISGNITNFSREPLRRVDIKVCVSYLADIRHVKQTLNTVISADSRILHDKGVTVRMIEMADSSLNFITRSWTRNSQYWDVYFDLLENFKDALDQAGIGIPYPQMDVHVHAAVATQGLKIDQ